MKKKNSTRSKRLLNYSLVAGAATVAGAANGQIVYTDIADATIGVGNSYNLDLDNDGNADFIITTSARSGSMSGIPYSGVGVLINTVGSNGVVSHPGTTIPANYADAMALNDLIDNAATFNTAPTSSSFGGMALGVNAVVFGNPVPFGDWLGQSNKYLGLVFDISGSNHYGWARLDVAADGTTFTIKDYAYDGTAGTGIPAGATVAGVESFDLSNQIDMFIANETLNLRNNNAELSNGRVIVLDLTGKEVASFPFTSTTATFDLSGLASGMYVVNAVFDQGRATEKLFVR